MAAPICLISLTADLKVFIRQYQLSIRFMPLEFGGLNFGPQCYNCFFYTLPLMQSTSSVDKNPLISLLNYLLN